MSASKCGKHQAAENVAMAECEQMDNSGNRQAPRSKCDNGQLPGHVTMADREQTATNRPNGKLHLRGNNGGLRQMLQWRTANKCDNG